MLKHHGSEGRIGPAGHSPECQTSLSKLASNLHSKSTSKPSICSPSCTAGCHLACFRLAQLGSKGGAAELKHNDSEGRIGSAARSPECQTSLSEPTRNELQTFNPNLPPGLQFARLPALLAATSLAFVRHSSVQGRCRRAKTPWQWIKDGSGPRPVAQSAERHFLNRLETSFKLQSKSNSKPSICSPSCTAGCHLACSVRHSSGPRAVPQS